MAEQAKDMIQQKFKQGLNVVYPAVISAAIVIGYVAALGVARGLEEDHLRKFFANPFVESFLAAFVVGLMVASLETWGLDRGLSELGGGLMPANNPAKRFMVRAALITLSVMFIMFLTNLLNGRVEGAILCGTQSDLQKKICQQAAAKASVEAKAEMQAKGEPAPAGAGDVVAPGTGSS